MLFTTTQQQEGIHKTVREFAETEIKPIAFILDKENEFLSEAIVRFGKMGLMGIPYPKEYGEIRLDIISYAIAVEELSRVDGDTGVILSAHVSLGSYLIFAFGTEEQKQRYLVPLVSGEKIDAFGLTEVNAGSDVVGIETTAVLEGDYYILNGGKIFITNADKVDTYVVFVSTNPKMGTRGISAFIVEKGWDGFTFGDHYDKTDIRPSSIVELIFNDVKVPKENLLGKLGQGFKIAMVTLGGGCIGVAAQALRITQGAYENALEYAKERVQFDKPTAQQQVISFKLADMATKLRCARTLIYSSAGLKENHEPYDMESAMAKQYASDVTLEICNDALQIFGGGGYPKGMEVERAYHDVKIAIIYEGTNEIQRIVIASHIIGKVPKDGGVRKKKGAITGECKRQIFKEGDAQGRVSVLVEVLQKDGYDLTVGIPTDTLIMNAERAVSAGKGIGEKENMKLIEDLVRSAGAAIGSSRPVAETLRYAPVNRYVSTSGQKLTGNLYIACGISGAGWHSKGTKDATTAAAVNMNANVPIFKDTDYEIVGDVMEILPLLSKVLDTREKKPVPPMKKMKHPFIKKEAPSYMRHVCNGCGYEYDQILGDPENDIASGTLFEKLSEEWIYPECGEAEDQFIEALGWIKRRRM